MRITRAIPSDFDFLSAVCSHGFFMLAPNLWEPRHNRLSTILTLDDELAVPITMRETGGKLVIASPAELQRDQTTVVRSAIDRMLRLHEDLSDFHARCRACATHADAAAMKFGRLLRGPSLFEDVIKVICTCNTAWRQTVNMVQQLVNHWGVPVVGEPCRGFPTAHALAQASTAQLKRLARVGYRAESIKRFARAVDSGRFDLASFECFTGTSDELHKAMRQQIHGVGDYAAGHLCMLLGHYDRLAIDTELMRHLRERHPRRRFTPAAIRRYYQAWHPYQFLAYWYELWCGYTERHGQADQWEPAEVARTITTPSKAS